MLPSMEILRRPSLSYAELVTAVNARAGVNMRFPSEMLPHLWNEAIRYGIDPVPMVAQSGKETAWGNYPGKVKWWFYNTAGLKTRMVYETMALIPTTDVDHPLVHLRFRDFKQGARAHAHHLRAYTLKLPVDEEILSHRYPLVTKVAVHFSELSAAWAPSATYGQEIEKIAAQLIATVRPPATTGWTSGSGWTNAQAYGDHA
jgi:hypothetical protein